MYLKKAKIIQLFCILVLVSCQRNDIEVFNGPNTNINDLTYLKVIALLCCRDAGALLDAASLRPESSAPGYAAGILEP